MSVAAVQARMAALMLSSHATTPTRIGGFTLRPEQERGLAAILRAVREFGGALVADPPGTGKTVLALATARALGATSTLGATTTRGTASTLVVAPAALRSQWLDSAAHAGIAIEFTSFESLSRGATPHRARVVIVDEAHHARTHSTRRYARLAECCLGARVLLLSATPVVNRAQDRDALLALFLGARSVSLTPAQLARCVVRARAVVADEPSCRPAIRPLGVIGRGADVPGLAGAIAALPPPLPLADGPHAAALVAMSLAMAWRSSLAALDAALRRRIQRGEAMRDLLRSGQAPSHALLRHFVLQDDATQLVMGALLAPVAHDAPDERQQAIATLDAHLDAVASLRERIRAHRLADAASRATALRELARMHTARRVVVFARHTETIRALYSALRSHPGVVAIVGSRVLAAAGRWSRDEVLREIGPRARPLRAGDARPDPRAIRILLATDVVAEGVEMQGMGIVVHADIPWTPARLEQRIGRVTRVGSLHREVFEARFGAPDGARELIRLGVRLRRKSEARDRALRDARAQARVEAVLTAWRAGVEPGDKGVAHGDDEDCDPCAVAAVRADRDAFIAVVGDPPTWLVGERRDGRWRVSSAPTHVARLLRASAGEPFTPADRVVHAHQQRIARAIERRTARTLVSSSDSTEPASSGATEPSATRRRVALVRARFARILVHAPSLARAELAARQSALLARLSRPLELAREQRLDTLLRDDLDDATFARRLGALLHGADQRTESSDGAAEIEGCQSVEGTAGNEKSRPSVPGRLRCMLILSRASVLPEPPAPALPSASPGTAAPR